MIDVYFYNMDTANKFVEVYAIPIKQSEYNSIYNIVKVLESIENEQYSNTGENKNGSMIKTYRSDELKRFLDVIRNQIQDSAYTTVYVPARLVDVDLRHRNILRENSTQKIDQIDQADRDILVTIIERLNGSRGSFVSKSYMDGRVGNYKFSDDEILKMDD